MLSNSEISLYRQRLYHLCLGWNVEIVESVISTNTVLLERAKAHDIRHSILWALEQTQGRGQMNKSWQTLGGDFITVSLGLPLSLNNWNGLSLVMGVVVAEILDCIGTRVVIKWPNDLCVFQNKQLTKLGGILIETTDLNFSQGMRYCVIGIGINLDTPKLSIGDNLPPTGCREWSPDIQSIDIMFEMLPKIIDAIENFKHKSFVDWRNRFQARDALIGKYLRCSDQTTGLYQGIDKNGFICLEKNGTITTHPQLSFQTLE